MNRAIVLLSAGLDSTVNLYEAARGGEVVLALTFDYGQRAAAQELFSAQLLCRSLGISHKVVTLDFFSEFGQSSLLDRSRKVPQGTEVEIDSHSTSLRTAKSVWVPNRNGIFLNLAAGYAEALQADAVIPGFNLEEAATFPDNTQSFLDCLNQSFALSTSNEVKAVSFTAALNKTQIVARGIQLGVDFSQIWPCYLAGQEWCGQCESCQRSQRAFESNGLNWKALQKRTGS